MAERESNSRLQSGQWGGATLWGGATRVAPPKVNCPRLLNVPPLQQGAVCAETSENSKRVRLTD